MLVRHSISCSVRAQSRRFLRSSYPSRLYATATSTTTSTSPLKDSLPFPPGVEFEESTDVRAYLRKWSQDHQKSIKDNAPELVQPGRGSTLPNSLFIRNSDDVTSATPEPGVDDTLGNAEQINDPEMLDESAGYEGTTASLDLKPGDAIYLVNVNRVKRQLAIFLGMRGVQSLYLLADGRWYADTMNSFLSHVVRGFAKPSEVAPIDVYLPVRTIEYQKTEDGGSVPFTSLGDIPPAVSQPLLRRLSALAEEMEESKRRYADVFEKIRHNFADENEYKSGDLRTLLRDYVHIEYDQLPAGAKLFLIQALFTADRLLAIAMRKAYYVGFLPERMWRSCDQVTEWARSYQDAAARASAGKSVSEELKHNPLIPFISKARRLVSKSRKIRLPTVECLLGPTLESARPASGEIERRPSGEVFTEDEKKIIEYLWLVYARAPKTKSLGGQRDEAIASLIIRAVGAYPKFTLDAATGLLFLKELGCLDPWSSVNDNVVSATNTHLGLNQAARLAAEETAAAVAALGISAEDDKITLPDTMAHLRKDWGDLEVFTIDSSATRVVDDAISIEPSEEFPDHYWIRVHIAHLSAFVPHDSPLLATARFMGTTTYTPIGPEPCMPNALSLPASVAANKEVLTFSALLGPDGSIKDVDVRPGIVRNVVRINLDDLDQNYRQPQGHHRLVVGQKDEARKTVTESAKEQQPQNLEPYRKSFDLMRSVVSARWEARFRENKHMDMLKLPGSRAKCRVAPVHVVQEGRGYDRIFRSEHIVGDLSIETFIEVTDVDRVFYKNQGMKRDLVAGCMMLASEAGALWTNARQIPVIYRFSEQRDLSEMNKLGPHDFYIGLATGESLNMTVNPALGIAGYLHVTSPLRRARDLLNHHQIDAYLKAQARQPELQDMSASDILYPRSREQLQHMIDYGIGEGNAATRSSVTSRQNFAKEALYRAFYFQEAKLPEILDIWIENPVNIKANFYNYAEKTQGHFLPLDMRVVFEPSEQGWEKMGKFRQFVPAKLTRLDPTHNINYVMAVGPPTDTPSVKDIRYPELAVN